MCTASERKYGHACARRCSNDTVGMGMGMGAGTVSRAKAGGNCEIYRHRCDPTFVRVVIGADAIEVVVGLPVLLKNIRTSGFT